MSDNNKCPCFLAHTDSCKLSELEKKLDEEIKSRVNWELAYVKAGEEIKNLEEQIRGMDRTVGSVVNHLIDRLDNQEKVLRELHELMRGLVSDLQDSNSLSKSTIKCYEGKLIKNLEMLDSPKKERSENPYLDLGMITSKDGELSDYTPSQFIRDYAKTHTLFSLYGLVSPEEDSGGER